MAAAAASTARPGDVCEAEATEGAAAGEKETVKEAVFQEEEAVVASPGEAEKETEAACWEAVTADWFGSLRCTRKSLHPCR
jgi:hypothetical protein